jgi:hypothetical protein
VKSLERSSSHFIPIITSTALLRLGDNTFSNKTVNEDNISEEDKQELLARLSSIICQKFLNEHQDSLLNVEMQGTAHRSVIQGSQEFDWMYNLTGLSIPLLKFGINSVTNTPTTIDYLKRCGYLRYGDDSCILCGQTNPTITHVLSMCKGALGEQSDEFIRIKWRHNYDLSTFINVVAPHLIANGFQIFVDLDDHPYYYRNFLIDVVETSQRPDVILWNASEG